MMASFQKTQKRWFVMGCVLAGASSIALLALTLPISPLSQMIAGGVGPFLLTCGLAVLAGFGAMLAICNLR